MEKLGEELLFDILVRIPIPYLIQYKCINKKWLSLISHRQFVRAKLKTSLLQQHPNSSHRLLLSSNPIISVNYEALADEEVVATAAITELDYPETVPAEKTTISFIGSCDGLVCLLLEENDDDISFIVWNPTSRQSRALPKPRDINVSLNNGEFFYGFGYDSVSDVYKLLVGRCDGDTSAIAEIFSLNTNCWKQLQGCCTDKVRAQGIYFNGSLHWLSTIGDNDNPECKIMSFDVVEERFRYDMIPLPCPHPDGLGVTIEDCLFVYEGDNSLHFEAWIMKEYGCSWSKVFSFSTESLPTNKYWTKFITFTREMKMVFDYCGWEVCMYDPERRSYSCFKVHNDEEYFESYITYVESLVSPYAKAAG